MHILLLNPPGQHAYIRDYYCSKVSKSNYLFQPVDLLMLSGTLATCHTVTVIDAIADHLTEEEFFDKFATINADAVISLVGSVAQENDLGFLSRLAADKCRLLVSGDIFLDKPRDWLERYPFIEAIILDFTSSDVLTYLEGAGTAATIISRSGESPLQIARAQREEFYPATPRHELFDSSGYNFPLVRHKAFATVLTDYGCPFPCTFCVMATLGYRYRTIESVVDELEHIKELGRTELFFMDQTFGAIRQRALELCRVMREKKFGFGWVCYSRVDLTDRELLTAMREAGCHTIIYGVESGNESILATYRKGYTKKQIREAFRLCRELGIRTVATFILGLPEETRQTAMETIDFLKEIDCDFVSFNIAVPRAGTVLRERAIHEGLVSEDTTVMDQSGTSIAMASHHLTPGDIAELKSLALRTFYLRPSYLLRRLAGIRSWYELKEQLREGFYLLRDH